ncbi:MAG: rod-binding protein [Syntrophales bacterium]|nr:rod-binding protein [Syntrophales bacterium]
MADLTIKPLTPEQQKHQLEADKKLKKVCADFESIFTYNLLKTMRKTIPGGGVLPKAVGTDTWEMMMDQHVAEAVSQKGKGLGLKMVLYNQLKKNIK